MAMCSNGYYPASKTMTVARWWQMFPLLQPWELANQPKTPISLLAHIMSRDNCWLLMSKQARVSNSREQPNLLGCTCVLHARNNHTCPASTQRHATLTAAALLQLAIHSHQQSKCQLLHVISRTYTHAAPSHYHTKTRSEVQRA